MNQKLSFIINYILKELFLFFVGGIVYMIVELLWRQHTHWTMGIVGGICFMLIGLINEVFTYKMSLELQAIISSIVITVVEFVSGCIINLHFGLAVWDYSNLPFNILGQVCLLFTILWVFLSVAAIVLDDYLRWMIFNEPYEKYNIVIYNKFIKKFIKKK